MTDAWMGGFLGAMLGSMLAILAVGGFIAYVLRDEVAADDEDGAP